MRKQFGTLLLCLALLPPLLARATNDFEWVEFPALKDFNGKTVTLNGWLYRPQGAGPFPALVLLHGCGGMYGSQGYVTPSYRHWAELLSDEGYIALLVDSFNPRDHWSICDLQKRPVLESRERVEDAYAALQWLNQRSSVAAGRVGLIGWSNGGTGTLYAMRPGSKAGPGFRAAVAFYPGCRTLSRAQTPYRSYSPLMILIGEADDWTQAAPCKELAAIAQAGASPVEIVTYPGAYHSFDRIGSPVRYRPNVRNLSKPDRLGATVGEHPQAREDAIKRTKEFFARVLKNQ